MKTMGAKKISEGAYFIVDITSYHNQIQPFDLTVATQTILSTSSSPESDLVPFPENIGEVDNEQ